jgi:hypothetical protein
MRLELEFKDFDKRNGTWDSGSGLVGVGLLDDTPLFLFGSWILDFEILR